MMETLPQDGFIFSGNKQESVPRTLFLDQRLTPLERNAWQVIRMMLQPDGITALPTYEQLRPYLTSMPYAGKASFETVARALTILRLTRWISLVKKRRAKDGSKLSNLYILHDEPLTPFEAMRLDDDYLALVCQSITHASKATQRVGTGVLQDIENDPFLCGKKLPTRLEILLGRVSAQTEHQEEHEKLSTTHESEESKTTLLRIQNEPISESEERLETTKNLSIRNQNKDVSSSNNINILLRNIKIPERFYKLSTGQQNGILKIIKNLTIDVQQKILIEWDERCRMQSIRKPGAYLFGIAQKAIKGEFNEFLEAESLQQSISPISKSSKPVSNDYVPTAEENAQIQQHIQNLKAIVLQKKLN